LIVHLFFSSRCSLRGPPPFPTRRSSDLTSIPAGSDAVFLIGSPATNPLIAKENFPDVTDQGIVLKSLTLDAKPAIIVGGGSPRADRKSTRLNSSHVSISYSVFCLKKKNT